MGKQSIAKNYAYNLMYQILIMIIPLITTPYLSRVLGAENIGIYSYTISINTYFILFGSLGIALYGQREIAKYQDDKEKRSYILCELFIIRFLFTFASLTIFVLISCLNVFDEKYKLFLLMLIRKKRY